MAQRGAKGGGASASGGTGTLQQTVKALKNQGVGTSTRARVKTKGGGAVYKTFTKLSASGARAARKAGKKVVGGMIVGGTSDGI